MNTGAVTLTMAGLTAGINQGGQPATIPSWAAGTSYTQGNIVENAYMMYEATNTATSGASAPTCTPSTSPCSGWGRQSAVSGTPTYYGAEIGGAFSVAAAYNLGGTSTAPVGGLWGTVFGAVASSGATNYVIVTGGEDDCSLAAGASTNRFVCFQYVRTGGQNGSNTNVGVSVAAGGGISGQVGFHDAVLFQNAKSPNGVGLRFQNQFGGAAGFQVMAGAFD